MTKFTGRSRKPCPSDGGVMAKACTPASPPSLGAISCAICSVLRLRSSHGIARRNTLPCATVGLPLTTKMRSNSG